MDTGELREISGQVAAWLWTQAALHFGLVEKMTASSTYQTNVCLDLGSGFKW